MSAYAEASAIKLNEGSPAGLGHSVDSKREHSVGKWNQAVSCRVATLSEGRSITAAHDDDAQLERHAEQRRRVHLLKESSVHQLLWTPPSGAAERLLTKVDGGPCARIIATGGFHWKAVQNQ